MRLTLPLRYSIPLLLAVVGLTLTAIAFYDGLERTKALIEDEALAHMVALGTRLSSVVEVRANRGELELARDSVARTVSERHLNRAVLFDDRWNVLVSTDYRLRSTTLNSADADVDLRAMGDAARLDMSAKQAWSRDRNTVYGIFPLQLEAFGAGLSAGSTGALLFEFDVGELKRINLAKHVRRAWLMGAVILCSLALVWWYVNSAVTRRLSRQAEVIEHVAAGRIDAAQGVTGLDEVGRFSAGVGRLVAELRERSKALAVSEERYRSVIHAMSEGVVIQRKDGTVAASNESAARILGVSVAQLVGMSPMDPRWQVVRDDGTPFSNDQNPAMVTLRTGKSQSNVVAGVYLPDGSVRWITINSEPMTLEAEHGEKGVVTTLTDITERRNAAAQGQRDRERLQAIVDTAMDGVVSTDGEMRISLFNRTAEKMFGYASREMLGKSIDVLMPDQFRANHGRLMQGFMKTGETRRSMGIPGEIVGLRADGEEFPIEASISMVKMGDEVILTAILRDISERKRAEAQREQLEAQLRQSQKLQSLGTLTGGIAHDFNNILTAIAGNARLAKLEMEDAKIPATHALMRSVAEIEKSAERATSLVRQVLAFGRRQESRRTVVDLAEVVGEALRFLRSTLPVMIQIRSSLPAGLSMVSVDASQIHQVIANLGSNAAHAIGDRPGVITVELDEVVLSKEVTSGSPDLPAGRYVRLTVADSGSGISPDILERIYEPFFTTKPVGVGTGLGLSVVHGIVKNHDGAIVVRSEANRGARFELYFPAVENNATSNKEAAGVRAAEVEQFGAGKTIVYLDDEEALVFLVTRLLERRGYRVLGFTNPQDALDTLTSDTHTVDAFVSDLAMPTMSGFDVMAKVRELRPEMPTILVSGYVRSQDSETAQRLGVRRLVLKPDTVDALADTLQEVLEGEAQQVSLS